MNTYGEFVQKVLTDIGPDASRELAEHHYVLYPSVPNRANAGVAAAQFNLGVMHDFGQGVPKNPQEAARWYRAAARQGHASAQFNLGGVYFDGQGVPQDHVRAYVWFTLAAIAGAPGGQQEPQCAGQAAQHRTDGAGATNGTRLPGPQLRRLSF